ncbi:hypothetical protein D3C73_851610 [compost metagenome]
MYLILEHRLADYLPDPAGGVRRADYSYDHDDDLPVHCQGEAGVCHESMELVLHARTCLRADTGRLADRLLRLGIAVPD